MKFVARARGRVTFKIEAGSIDEAEEKMKEITAQGKSLVVFGDEIFEGEVADFKATNVSLF